MIEIGGLKGTKPCSTLTVGLVGKEGQHNLSSFTHIFANHIIFFLFSSGYSANLPIALIQEYGISNSVAKRFEKLI